MRGLRLILSSVTPGPWSNAGKAIFDVKGIEYVPVEQVRGSRDEALFGWTGQYQAPVAMYNEERPRARWDELLLLAERLQPEPRLIPADAAERAQMFGLSHELIGEEGLGWNIRVYRFEEQERMERSDPRSLQNPKEWMSHLHNRYFDHSHGAQAAMDRVREMLALLSRQLHENRARGSAYLVGDHLTAADIYWTAVSIYVTPFAEEHCPMPDYFRAFCEWHRDILGSDLDQALIEHRDYILTRYFKLPIPFWGAEAPGDPYWQAYRKDQAANVTS